MKNNIKKKKLILVAGRSSSGKSSVTRTVCENLGLKMVKSYTTRPPREKEIQSPEKCDHIFITDDDVEIYKDEIAAYTEINGYKYFTTDDILDNSDVYVVDPNGMHYLKNKYQDKYEFITIYIRTPRDVAFKRAKKRGDDMKEYQKRIDDENEQFIEFEKNAEWEYHILNNDTFERAVITMEKMIKKELCL